MDLHQHNRVAFLLALLFEFHPQNKVCQHLQKGFYQHQYLISTFAAI